MSLKNVINRKPLTEQINKTKQELFPILEELSLQIEFSNIEYQVVLFEDNNRFLVPDEFYKRLKEIRTLEKNKNAIHSFIDIQLKSAEQMDENILNVNRKVIVHNVNYSIKSFNKYCSTINDKISNFLLEIKPYFEQLKPKPITYKEIIDAMCERKDNNGKYSYNLDGFKMTKKLYDERPKMYMPSTQTITVPTDIKEKLGLENGSKVYKCDLAEAIAKRK